MDNFYLDCPQSPQPALLRHHTSAQAEFDKMRKKRKPPCARHRSGTVYRSETIPRHAFLHFPQVEGLARSTPTLPLRFHRHHEFRQTMLRPRVKNRFLQALFSVNRAKRRVRTVSLHFLVAAAAPQGGNRDAFCRARRAGRCCRLASRRTDPRLALRDEFRRTAERSRVLNSVWGFCPSCESLRKKLPVIPTSSFGIVDDSLIKRSMKF